MPKTIEIRRVVIVIKQRIPRLAHTVIVEKKEIAVDVTCEDDAGFTNVELTPRTLQIFRDGGQKIVAFSIVRHGWPTLCWPSKDDPNDSPSEFLSTERHVIRKLEVPVDCL